MIPHELANAITLDISAEQGNSGSREWNFQIANLGNYNIQMITEGELSDPLPLVAVKIDDLVFNEPLESTFVIENSGTVQTVSQFQKTVTFDRAGTHRLSIANTESVKSVRLVPHFKNAFGSGEYEDEWRAMHESPEKQEALEWFKEAKFGMFIHWGLYSQAAGSWKGTRIEEAPYPGPSVAEWLMFKFRIPRDEYAELAKTFNPDKSFAQNIARLAKDAGMKYVVITSKHHDGFALFDSASSEYDMVDATPYGADAIKELYDACQKEGVEFGVYYSHGNDWADGSDGNYANIKKLNDSYGVYTHASGKNTWDPSPNTHAEYFESKAYPQIKELIEKLPNLRLLWFDGEGFITEEQAFRFYKLVYDLNPSVIVNRRVGYLFGDYLDAGDNKIPEADEQLDKHWETCGTTNNSWGYKEHDHDWKSTREMLYWFVDIASKGGNYLLNIGPDGKGHVPEKSAALLREVGKWLEVNGDAIYGTRRWTTLNEGGLGAVIGKGTGHRPAKGFENGFTNEHFWFTSKEDKVYAISLVEAGNVVRILSLNTDAGTIKSVRLLGYDKEIEWKQTAEALELNLDGVATDENGFAVEVSF